MQSDDRADGLLLLALDPFLQSLRALGHAPSVAELRAAVAQLVGQLGAASGPFAPAPEGSALPIPRSYLLAELEQIGAALSLERARYYAERLIRGLTAERTNGVNDINLNRWKTYDDIQTDSLWQIDRRDSSGAHTAGYWGNFVPQIPNQMMRRYTRPGDWVLDTFAGSGTTLIEARRLGRNCIGVELQERVAAEARERVAAEPNAKNVVGQIITGDSASFDFAAALAEHGQPSARLVLMHPPYFDIIRFSDDPRDLSNTASITTFLEQLGSVVDRAAAALAVGGFLVLVIGDKYARGEWIPLGFQAMNELLQRGLLLKSIVVKNFEDTAGKRAQKELWRYRALAGGFFVFKHEYVFVFEKR